MPDFTRKDLLALTLDGLTQLANAGLVKRSVRDLENSLGPQISEEADGCIVATYADGTVTRLPPGKSPGDASCTCPAGGLCRHRVTLVLAYQQLARAAIEDATEVTAPVAWDPADIPPEAVDALLVATTRNELQRLLRQPLEVRLLHGVVPTASLPMATVRFLVPHDLAYARCDCVAGQQCAHVALAVEGFRVGRQRETQIVSLGGEAAVLPAQGDDLRARVLELVGRVVEEGVIAGAGAMAAPLEVCRRAALDAGATWLLLALEDFEEQLAAYAARGARHDEMAVLSLLVEMLARSAVGGARRAAALGVGEALETSMGATRLVSLGARAFAEGNGVRACVLLADSDTGSALVYEKTFAAKDASERFTPAQLPLLRFAPGIQFGALARGQLLTAVAKRRADGLLRLGAGRGGKTALVPHAGDCQLPEPMLLRHLDRQLEQAVEMPPALIRPRHRVRDVHLFNVGEVLGHAFAPGDQCWEGAVKLAEEGGVLALERRYDAGAPLALEVLFEVFEGKRGTLRQIAGPTRVEDGRLICEPWMLYADSLVVPDVEVPREKVQPPLFSRDQREIDVIQRALRWLAEAVHQGRRNLARDHAGRGQQLAAALAEAGYQESAQRLQFLLDDPHATQRFADCAVWLLSLADE